MCIILVSTLCIGVLIFVFVYVNAYIILTCICVCECVCYNTNLCHGTNTHAYKNQKRKKYAHHVQFCSHE